MKMIALIVLLILALSTESFITSGRFPSVSVSHRIVTQKKSELFAVVLTPSIISKMSIDDMIDDLIDRGVEFQDCITRPQLVKKLMTFVDKEATEKEMMEQAVPAMNVINNNQPETENPLNELLPFSTNEDILKQISSDPRVEQIMRDPKVAAMIQAMKEKGPEGVKSHLSNPGYSSFYLFPNG